jgi:hypothetical protein
MQRFTVETKREMPDEVIFNKDTLKRFGGRGDNWCQTWAMDNSLITSMDDGDWLNNNAKVDLYHHRLYRILGESDNFFAEDIPEYPDFLRGQGGWFGYGIIDVDGVLYSMISKTPDLLWSGPFRGVKLLKSTDNGQHWSQINKNSKTHFLNSNDSVSHVVDKNTMFFLEEFGKVYKEKVAYPFSYIDFIQCGKGYSTAKDNFIYMHSPEGASAHCLMLARVLKDSLELRDNWEYFTGYDNNGQPQWSSDIQKRKPVHIFPEKNRDDDYFGWYSWLPSVVWNEGLQLYIMVNGGTYAGANRSDSDEDYYDRWMHTKTGSLGFWYSENPYGPWKEFFYTDYWTVDSPHNLTYQPKLSPKWISESGEKMVLVWSDAMKNKESKSHSLHYKWNQMEIDIKLN